MDRSFPHNCYKSKDNSSAWTWDASKSKWHGAAGSSLRKKHFYQLFIFSFLLFLQFSLIIQICKSWGWMQMYEQMHILSPLVPPREFFFIRHCQQIELGVWLIVDFSYDCSKEKTSPSRSWKLPSGCMIQNMPNGYSKVSNFITLTW